MISLKNVSFRYSNHEEDLKQLDNISLDIKPGEFLLLTGKSGSGKTSIIRILNGLVPHYYEGELTGSVEIDGQDIKAMSICDVSRKVSTVFQNPKSQFFNLDTTTEIVFFLENMGYPLDKIKERLYDTVKLFGIEYLLERDIFQLSGGEKQLIAIAGAYASDTDIVLMDEPTSNLDLASIEKITDMLKHLKDKGKTVIISEHRLYYLKNVIDRAVYIDGGKIAHDWNSNEFVTLEDEYRKSLGLRPLDLAGMTVENLDLSKSSSEFRDSLILNSLSYRYPKSNKQALKIKDVSLELGSITGLVGKNGQGKSTFANALSGLIKTKKPYVYYKSSQDRLSNKDRVKVSYMVMQDVGYQLFTQSVRDELELGVNKHLSHLDIDSILDTMQLTHLSEIHPLALSGGQKQRVAIASGISSGAKIMIFDEPTSGMDYFHMKKTAELLLSIKSPDTVVIVITHDIEFMSLVCDYVLLMEDGKVTRQNEFDTNELRMTYNYLIGH